MARMAWVLALALVACGGSATDAELFGSDGVGAADAGGGGAGGSDDTDSGTKADAGVCVPGKVEACACVGGLVGAQQCLPTGDGYGPCECPDAPDGGDAGDVGDAGDEGDASTEAGPDAADEDDGGPIDAGPDAPNWGDSGDVCAPAQCIPMGVAGINCDPECGPVSSHCAAACDITKPLPLAPGVTWVRTPPISEKQCGQCKDNENWWAIAFEKPKTTHCIVAVGPDGSRVFPGGWSSETPAYPNLCGDWQTPTCFKYSTTPNPSRTGFITIGIREPTPGALFRIELRMDQSCPEAQCVGGCNGDGALYL